MRGGGGAAGIAATVGIATGTETSNVSPGLRLAGMTTFMSWPLMLYWTVSPGDLRGPPSTRVRHAPFSPRPRPLDGVEVDGGLENDFHTARTPSAGPGRPPSLLVLFFSLLSERWRFQRRDPSSKNTLGVLVTDPGQLVQRVAAKTRVENSRASGVRPLESSSGCSPGACAGYAEQPRSFTQAYACRTRL